MRHGTRFRRRKVLGLWWHVVAEHAVKMKSIGFVDLEPSIRCIALQFWICSLSATNLKVNHNLKSRTKQ
jgi:hypothetical protein